MPMKIKAIVPWMGTKRGMAPLIAAQLGPHRAYWEPFAGSMAVLLAKPVVSQETANDLHGDLILLALVLQHDRWGPWLYRQLRRTLPSEEMHHVSRAQVQDPPVWSPLRIDPFRLEEKDARRAFWFFINSWLGRNGVIGTKENNNHFCVRFTTNGGIQGTRFASAVDSIPAWRRRLREVTILRRDGFELLERIEDQPGTAIYCDPPYLEKGATYIHDFTAADHDRLAACLARFERARVVLSYYDHPRLAELYPAGRWERIDCSRAKSLSVQGQRGSKSERAPEVLLVNGPVAGDADLFGD